MKKGGRSVASREESLRVHVGTKLFGHFLKHLLGEDVGASGRILLELNELDDVSGGRAAAVVSEDGAVAVELLHHFEFLHSDSDDDDGERQLGGVHNQALGLVHVVDLAVGDDQENVVNLELQA